MSRSLKKGPYVDQRILKKVNGKRPQDVNGQINIWSRSCTITPEMIGFTFGVHNGRKHLPVFVVEDMVGHKFGEFSPTRTFFRHGGKMQKDIEKKGQEAQKQSIKTAQDKAKK